MIQQPQDKPAEAGRYGFGTSEAIDSVEKYLGISQDVTVMLAINIATLLRNAIGTKDVKADVAVREVRRTMQGIANEIADICKLKWKDKQHHVLFYLANTDKVVPPEYMRAHGNQAAITLDNAMRLISRELKSADQTDGNVNLHIRLADKMLVPSYKGIAAAIDSMTQSTVPILLISHMPLDYHVAYVTHRKGLLFRSHTGMIVNMTPTDLGKIVFGQDNVPFYQVTHVLFGDKYLMKGSLERKDKVAFLEMAARDHLGMHTNSFVEARVKDNCPPLPYKL